MILSLIVAASTNNVIGRSGVLPWNLPDDLKYFREKTLGKPVIMGRRTYESVGKPLPKRHNIVISRMHQEWLKEQGVSVAGSLDEALILAEADSPEEIFVIGGAEIFKEALPIAHRLYLTRVHAHIEGDAVMPEIDFEEWKKISEEHHEKDTAHQCGFTFEVYEKQRWL